MDARFDDLKKFIDKRTKELCGKHDDIGSEMVKIYEQQGKIDDTVKDTFRSIQN